MASMDSTQSVNGPPASHGSTSTSFLERLKTQDSLAWHQLARVYGPLIYYWCRKHGVNAEDAADVFQEVVAAVASAIGRFRREDHGGRFHGWLWTIPKRKIQDHYRSLAKREEARGGTDAQRWLAEIPDHPNAQTTDEEERSQFDSAYRHALELARAGVEEHTWQAFWAVVVDGREPSAVAADLGISVQSVYDAKYRIRRKIRQELEGLVD